MRNTSGILTKAKICQNGFTIVEVVVTLGIIGVLFLSMNTAMVNVFSNSQTANVKLSRDDIVNQIRTVASNKKAMATTISKMVGGVRANPDLHNCACGGGPCHSMVKPYLPVQLYDWADTLQAPLFYDAVGIPCDPTVPSCVIRVTTSFFAECVPNLNSSDPTPPYSCGNLPADFVAISYTIDQNPAAPVSPQNQVKSITGQVFLQVSELDPAACL